MFYFWILLLFVGLCQDSGKAIQCVSRGRFPNNEIQDCRGYTICLIGANGTFTHINLTCPPTFVYSHIDSQCTNVTTYHCYPEVNCTEIGSFINPESKDCTTYIACIEGLSNVVTARLIECPQGTVFSPITRMCVNKTENECVKLIERRKILPNTDEIVDFSRHPENSVITLRPTHVLIITVILSCFVRYTFFNKVF